MKNVVFWDMRPRDSCKKRRVASIIRVETISELVFLHSVLQLLVTANVVPSPLFLFTLMMEETRYAEMSILTRATRRRIPEDDILL
jgi:hypothetical protein